MPLFLHPVKQKKKKGVGVCSVLLCNITKWSKEAFADPTAVQQIIAARYGIIVYSDYFVVDNMVYMGAVNSHSMYWYV